MKKYSISIVTTLIVIIGICTVGCGVSSRANNFLDVGNEALSNGKYEEAIDAYKSCLQLDDENADAYYGLAQAYFAEDAFDEAEEVAEEGFARTSNFRLKNYIDFLEEEAEERHFKELEAIGLPYFVKEAICSYNDLTDHEEITQEMMEEVVSLQIRLFTYHTTAEYDDDAAWSDIPYDETQYTYYAEASVNDSDFWFIYPYAGDKRYEVIISMIEGEYSRRKFDSFFSLKDPDDISQTLKDRDEMLMKFPFLANKGATYICDPEIKPRELRRIQDAICYNVLFDEKKDMTVLKTIDLSTLELLPNLQRVEYHINLTKVEEFADMQEYKKYLGFEFINSPVPVTEVIEESNW